VNLTRYLSGEFDLTLSNTFCGLFYQDFAKKNITPLFAPSAAKKEDKKHTMQSNRIKYKTRT